MWSALRDLFGALSPAGRFWLTVVIVAALLAVFVTLTLRGVDAGPLWALLGSG
jgi:hypothetical protein